MNLSELSEWEKSRTSQDFFKFLKYSTMEHPTDIKIIISSTTTHKYEIIFYDEYKILSNLVTQSFETVHEAMNFADKILERGQKLKAFF